MKKDQCNKCGSVRMVLRGTQMVCMVCGQMKQSTNMFATEYQRTQLRRTIKHIQEKDKKERKSKQKEPLFDHLKKTWGHYILLFQGFILTLAQATQTLYNLPLDYIQEVEKLWISHIEVWANEERPLISNWTVAKSQQIPDETSKYVLSKRSKEWETRLFLKQEDKLETQAEDSNSDRASNESKSRSRSRSESVCGVEFIKKKRKAKEIAKKKVTKVKVLKPFFQKRALKQKCLNLVITDAPISRRKSSTTRRKGSVSNDQFQSFVENVRFNDGQEFLRSVLKQNTQMTEVQYEALVDVFLLKITKIDCKKDFKGQLKKIKKNYISEKIYSEYIKTSFSETELSYLSSGYKREAVLLNEFLQMIDQEGSVEINFSKKYQNLNLTNINPEFDVQVVSFFLKKCQSLIDYIDQVSKLQCTSRGEVKYERFKQEIQDKSQVIDFNLAITLLIVASYKVGSPILIRDLYSSIRQKKIPYMDGFAQRDYEYPFELRQSLCMPRNLPHPSTIRASLLSNRLEDRIIKIIGNIGARLLLNQQITECAQKLHVLVHRHLQYQGNQQELLAISLLIVSYKLIHQGQKEALNQLRDKIDKAIGHELFKFDIQNMTDLKYLSKVNLKNRLSLWNDSIQNDQTYTGQAVNNFFDRIIPDSNEKPQYFFVQNFHKKLGNNHKLDDEIIQQEIYEKLQLFLLEDISMVVHFKEKIERILKKLGR